MQIDVPVRVAPNILPFTITYSVVKAYWDAHALENDFQEEALKTDLINFMKMEYKDSGISFVDEEETIVSARIYPELVKKYLH